MNQPSLESVGASLVGKIFAKIWENAKNPPQWVKDKYQVSDPFGFEAKKYVAHVRSAYNSMRIIGMSDPVPIDGIYINVNVRNKEDFSDYFDENYWDTEDLEETKKYKAKTIPAERVISDNSRVLVLGRPGAGKTTFLKYLAISILNKPKLPMIPVFVPLKEWSQEKNVKLETIITRQFEVCGFNQTREFVRLLLRKGKCLILLDGFDELDPDFRSAAITQIEHFVKDWGANKFVMTCRTAANTYVFNNFIEVEVSDFTENQIHIFIRKWFKGSISEKCIEELKAEENKGIMDLASNPLLLTLICIAYRESLSFPDNRVQLYETALDALLKKWDASRDIIRYNPYKRLTTSKKELLLSNIAAQTANKKGNIFDIDDVSESIDSFMLELTDIEADDYEGSRSVLEAVEAQHGVIYKVAKNEYGFSHLTFKEYYIARHIVDSDNKQLMDKVLKRYIGEPSWNEILLICCGLQKEASQFIYKYKLTLDEMRNYNVNHLIDISKSCIRDSSLYPETLSILLVLIQVFSTRTSEDYGYGFLDSMANIARLSATAVASAYKININVENAAIRVTKLGLLEGRDNVQRASAEVEVSRKHWDDWTDYLVGLYVILICLNNEATVRKTYRKEILDSLFEIGCSKPSEIESNSFLFDPDI